MVHIYIYIYICTYNMDIYGRYHQFRFLKWPLKNGLICGYIIPYYPKTWKGIPNMSSPYTGSLIMPDKPAMYNLL